MDRTELTLTIIPIIISVFSLLYAINANSVAEKANNLVEEQNKKLEEQLYQSKIQNQLTEKIFDKDNLNYSSETMKNIMSNIFKLRIIEEMDKPYGERHFTKSEMIELVGELQGLYIFYKENKSTITKEQINKYFLKVLDFACYNMEDVVNNPLDYREFWNFCFEF